VRRVGEGVPRDLAESLSRVCKFEEELASRVDNAWHKGEGQRLVKIDPKDERTEN